MTLTQKETSLLKDLKGQEELCIGKYGRYAAEAKAEQKEEGVLSEAESRSFDLQRRRNALQHALRDAIAAENYEEAARLRDEIRALPNE